MCGACDCPSCGPAQGYEVVRVYDSRLRRYVYRNPEDCTEQQLEDDGDGDGESHFDDEVLP
jgi:hypothetical protein